jgi:hypothetical protein
MSCGICFENYSASVQSRKPKVLRCGHSLCSECVSKIDKCAVCRKKIQNKNKIPYNFELMNNSESKVEPEKAKPSTKKVSIKKKPEKGPWKTVYSFSSEQQISEGGVTITTSFKETTRTRTYKI